MQSLSQHNIVEVGAGCNFNGDGIECAVVQEVDDVVVSGVVASLGLDEKKLQLDQFPNKTVSVKTVFGALDVPAPFAPD